MRRIVVIGSGRVLNAASSVVAVRLYTELLKPEQVGRLSLLLASISLFCLVLVAPVSSWVTRKSIEWHVEGTLIRQLRHPLYYSLWSSALAVAVCFALIRTGLLAMPLLVAPLIGFAVLGTGVSAFGSQLFNYLNRPLHYVILSVATSWAGVAFAGILCLRLSATAEAWMIGITGSQVVMGLVSIFMIRKTLVSGNSGSAPAAETGQPGFDLWAIALYSTPMLIGACLSWAQTDGYRYFFVHMVNERTLGLFATGFAIGMSPMLLLERVLNDTYLPLLTRAVALNDREHWPDAFEAFASASILPLVLFTVLACSGTQLFAKLLVSHTYYAVAWLGAFGALAKCLQMMSSMYVGFSYAALETAHLIGPYCIGAAVTICFILLLSPIPPLVGFGISLISGAAANLIAIGWAANKRYHLRFPFLAFGRAAALGIPVAGLNWVTRTFFPSPGVPIVIAVLGIETLYIASLCWILHPKDADSDRRSAAPVHPLEQEAVV